MSFWRKHYEKANLIKNILLITLPIAAFVLLISLHGIRINEKHFPDRGLIGAIIGYVDKNKNGYLNKEELEEAKILPVWGECSDLSGVEKLKNLERISFRECSDLSGIEKLTNLKSLGLSNTCPDLSAVENLTNLEEISIENCVFSDTFVFDNEASVTNLIFRNCVFENGFFLNNDSVENIEFGTSGFRECEASGDFVFADCDALNIFRAYFKSEQEKSCSIDLSGCDNLDIVTISNDQVLTSADLSNCNKLRSFAIYDYNEKVEINLNISNSPNIEEAFLRSRAIKKLDISDCPHLISASEQTPHEGDYHVSLIYESEDGLIVTDKEQIMFIK